MIYELDDEPNQLVIMFVLLDVVVVNRMKTCKGLIYGKCMYACLKEILVYLGIM